MPIPPRRHLPQPAPTECRPGGVAGRDPSAEGLSNLHIQLVIDRQRTALDALLTLSSKGQLVIPARLRQLLGLNPGDRLELSLEADGLLLRPHGSGKTSSAQALIGCTGYSGPPIPIERLDPALYASQPLP